MFTTKSETEMSKLEEVITDLLENMFLADCKSEEYAKMADQLTKIYKLKAEDKPNVVSHDTLALIAGNLLGIVLIVGHERANVVTSKALALVRKML